MKFRSLKNWDNLPELEGLIFFAQLWEELLFDYSLDTYKPSAMNTTSLCREVRELIDDIEEDLIESANLQHVVKEFLLNLRRDEVAKALLDVSADAIEKNLTKEDSTLTDKKVLVNLVYSKLYYAHYKIKTEELLLEAVANGREKNRIRSLTRSYITTLLNIGYSSRYLYPISRHFFYTGGRKIKNTNVLKEYFKLVSGEDLDYTAIFKASNIFGTIKTAAGKLNISVTAELDESVRTKVAEKNFDLSSDEIYIVVSDNESKDVFSARVKAERDLELISTLMNIYHHKEVPTWKSNALMINTSSDTSRLVNLPHSPMLLCSDNKPEIAADKLNDFLTHFTLSEPKSFQKYTRAIELHSLSLKSESPESQLLNLWVALETLTPSKLNKNRAKINNVIESILPILSLEYIHSLIQQLERDLNRWNRSKYISILNKLDGKDEKHKLLKLLLLSDKSAERDELYRAIDKFHLLRNRCHYFSEKLAKTSKISDILDSHWLRVDWQLRRIYRARNQIVHAGHTPSYMGVLVKNIHDYFDKTIGCITRLAGEEDRVETIDQAFKYAEVQYAEYRTDLGEDVPINNNNLVNLLHRERI